MSLADKTALFSIDADLVHRFVHGNAATTLTTEGGPLRTLAKFVADNQAAVEAAVANVSGADASLIAYDGASLLAIADEAKPMASYTALRNYTGRAAGVRITAIGLAGIFRRDVADTTSADNGGTVIDGNTGTNVDNTGTGNTIL